MRFDAGYFNESVHSSYADADLRMRGMKVPVYRGRRENISRDGFDFSAEYTGRTGRNDYMVRAGMSRMKKDSYSYNGRHLQRTAAVSCRTPESVFPERKQRQCEIQYLFP